MRWLSHDVHRGIMRIHGQQITARSCTNRVEQDDGAFWGECVDNVANAWSAGFDDVGVYMCVELTKTGS